MALVCSLPLFSHKSQNVERIGGKKQFALSLSLSLSLSYTYICIYTEREETTERKRGIRTFSWCAICIMQCNAMLGTKMFSVLLLMFDCFSVKILGPVSCVSKALKQLKRL